LRLATTASGRPGGSDEVHDTDAGRSLKTLLSRTPVQERLRRGHVPLFAHQKRSDACTVLIWQTRPTARTVRASAGEGQEFSEFVKVRLVTNATPVAQRHACSCSESLGMFMTERRARHDCAACRPSSVAHVSDSGLLTALVRHVGPCLTVCTLCGLDSIQWRRSLRRYHVYVV
jgi:hypothetical protein